MTVSVWQADNSQPVREVDVLVVGAGLVGSGVAYFAAQAGREVVVTEMRDIALGASGRNAGFMITGLDTYYHHAIEKYGQAITRDAWHLSRRTHDIWHHIIAKHPYVGCQQAGSFLLAESDDEAEDLRKAYALLKAEGHDAIFHEQDPYQRGYIAAIEQPQDCSVQPVTLAQAVFRESGAELVANNELYHIEQIDEGRVRVYTRQYIFHAKKVMLCTNAYSPLVHPYFVGKVVPTRAQCFITPPIDEWLVKGIGYSDYGYMYYRMTFDHRFLIGGGRKQHKPLENDTTEDRITDPVQNTLEDYCRVYFPEIVREDGTVNVERRWSGIMGFTPDGLPLVGSVPGMPDVGFAVGFTGHGLAMGAGTAERAVDFLLNETDPGFLHVKRLELT